MDGHSGYLGQVNPSLSSRLRHFLASTVGSPSRMFQNWSSTSVITKGPGVSSVSSVAKLSYPGVTWYDTKGSTPERSRSFVMSAGKDLVKPIIVKCIKDDTWKIVTNRRSRNVSLPQEDISPLIIYHERERKGCVFASEGDTDWELPLLERRILNMVSF